MDPAQLLQAVLSLLFVLALLVGLAWLARRGGLVAPVAGGQKSLRVVEVMPLDMRHKVIRLQDGAAQYLILIGGETPVLLATPATPEAAVC